MDQLPVTAYSKETQIGKKKEKPKYFLRRKKSLKPWFLDKLKNGIEYHNEGIEWAAKVREKFGNMCQRCGSVNPKNHAHHIHPRSSRPGLKYDLENGLCVCGLCHRFIHDHPEYSRKNGFLKLADD